MDWLPISAALLVTGALALCLGSFLLPSSDGTGDTLRIVHRMLSLHLGTPPETVSWQWTDKDKNFHRDETMTPQEFAQRYVDLDLDSYVCMVDDPRPSSPRNHVICGKRLA